jgi:beta-N-acetylhexosaminidase
MKLHKVLSLQLLLFFAFLCSHALMGQYAIYDENAYVDSAFYSMTTDERIGQLFMIRSYTKVDYLELKKNVEYIQKYKVGGIIFFQGSPLKQIELTNTYQAASKTPLLIGLDAESGFGMRYPETAMKFPDQLTMGAVADDQIIYDMGNEIASHCKKMGVHMTFSPLVDINNNSANPVINDRSFGEDKYIVTTKAMHYMRGLQENGVLGTAKHFPGHGDTHTDSHHDLPIIPHSEDRIHDLELFPFKAMINEGVASIMIGHLHVPSLESRPNRPATLSRPIITDLLRNQLGYDGLVVTDAMDMQGVTKYFKGGIAEAEAIAAGVDLVLMPFDLPAAINKTKEYIIQGKISPSQFEESVRRVLRAKFKSNAHIKKPLGYSDIPSVFNSNEAVSIKSKIVEAAITLVEDNNNILPLKIDGATKYMSLGIGTIAGNDFHKRLSSYADFSHYTIKREIPPLEKAKIMKEAAKYDFVVVSIHDINRTPPKNFNISTEAMKMVTELNNVSKVILCLYGTPYTLKYFNHAASATIVAYENDALFHDITAQAIFGAIPFNGKLPISSTQYSSSMGITKNANGTLGYSVPERVNLDSKALEEIDFLASDLIKKNAAPGCVILVAKDNKIVFHKAYGHHTYTRTTPVNKSDVFDLASVTKILGSTISLMKLYDDKELNLDATLESYLPQASGTNKANIVIRDMLAHHARLIPYIPFHESTVIKGKTRNTLKSNLYRSFIADGYSTPISQNIFLKDNFKDSIWRMVYNSEMRSTVAYRYSDLGFFFAKAIIENRSNMKLDVYADNNFYKPLNLRNTTYNPQNKIKLSSIVPTEKDDYWRNQLVHGTVHDMGAAMLGGVGGHAGLFSNAQEVAVLMQMLLNDGKYGGKKYLNPHTIETFTSRHHLSTRRGLGFDMKELDRGETMNMADRASSKTFGHTGFTGTCTFADPEHNIVFVFLSNRTFPSADNNILHREDYRPRIQNVIYKAMIK